MKTKTKIKQKSIKSTNWARRFRRNCAGQYNEAIEIAEKLREDKNSWVCIYHNNDTGDWQWSIVPDCESLTRSQHGFWLDSAPTQKGAIAICREMGWRYYLKKSERKNWERLYD